VAKSFGLSDCEKAYKRASVARMPKKAAKARTRNIMREFSILIIILKYTPERSKYTSCLEQINFS
jgi:hypothetical protein